MGDRLLDVIGNAQQRGLEIADLDVDEPVIEIGIAAYDPRMCYFGIVRLGRRRRESGEMRRKPGGKRRNDARIKTSRKRDRNRNIGDHVVFDGSAEHARNIGGARALGCWE